MFRRTATSLGVLTVLREELAKLPAWLSFHAQEGSQKTVDSASKTFEFLKGEDPSADSKKAEWQKKHKEMYNAILAKQQAEAAALAAKKQASREHLSVMEKMKLTLADAKTAMSEMTSMKAGAMSLLQHCTASHAAEVAIDQGIDVKNVQMVLEKQAKKDGIGFEEVVVGYIDAPAASQEEVMAFAEKLHKACPVANSMHVEWRRRDEDVHHRDKAPEGSVSFETFREGKMPIRPTDHSADTMTSAQDETVTRREVPLGMPGSRRMRDTSSTRRWGEEDGADEGLHLPGVKPRKASYGAVQDQPHMEVSRIETKGTDHDTKTKRQ